MGISGISGMISILDILVVSPLYGVPVQTRFKMATYLL